MRSINEIIVHCSATREGQHIPVETIKKGRDIDRSGAHTKGHNKNSIGICYCGGVESDGKTPKDTRTPEQKESLLHVLKTLMAMFPLATIYSHNEFANKACPSFDATNEYENL